MEVLVALIVGWFIFGIATAYVAENRGTGGLGWLFAGLLLGPIGLVMAFATSSPIKCPHCRSGVPQGALKCPKCQSLLTGGTESSLRGDVQYAQVAKSDTKKCPDCAEDVKAAARKCRFCGFQFPEPAPEPEPVVRPIRRATPAAETRYAAPRKATDDSLGAGFWIVVVLVVGAGAAVLTLTGGADRRSALEPEPVNTEERDAAYGLAIDEVIKAHPSYQRARFEAPETVTARKVGAAYQFDVVYHSGIDGDKWPKFECAVKDKTASCKDRLVDEQKAAEKGK